MRGSFCCLRSYGYFTPVGQPYSGVVPYSRTGVHTVFRLIHQLVQRSDFTVLIVSANIAVLLMAVLSILSLMWIEFFPSVGDYNSDPCGVAAGQYIAVPTSASDAGAKANPHD